MDNRQLNDSTEGGLVFYLKQELFVRHFEL